MELWLNNITEPTHFHAYVVIVVQLLWLLSKYVLFNLCICVWTILYAIVWILLKTCCCINFSLWIVDYLASSIWCHSPCVFLSRCVLLQASKGHTSFYTMCVRTPCISLDSLQGHALASDKDILLTSVLYRNQCIALIPIVGTPTPNSLRSNWDFLLGRYPYTLVGLALSTPSPFSTF